MTMIRTAHPAGFRCGEWATLLDTVSLPMPGRADRTCYTVEFGDGVCDWWPVLDPDGRYEFTQEAENDRPRV